MNARYLLVAGLAMGFVAPVRAQAPKVATTAELPPPPDVKRVNAPASNVATGLTFWYETFAKGTRCVLEEREVSTKIQGLGNLISKHKDPAEQKLLIAYFNEHLLPTARAWLAGVPGMGTYNELSARRQSSIDWLAANRPGGTADTKAQAETFIAAYQAYQKRAAEDHAFVKALNAVSPCHRKGTPPAGAGSNPLINGFMSWQHETSPEGVERAIGGIRDKLVPQGISGDSEGRRLLEEAANGGQTSLRAHGKLLEDSYRVISTLDAEKPTAERMTWFAPLFTGERQISLAEAPQRLTKMQADLGTLIVERIALIKPSKPVAGPPVKGVFTGKHILASRAISKLSSSEEDVTDTQDVGGGKVLVRKYRVAYTGFQAQYVTTALDLWRDLPGLPLKDVCALRFALARKYTKGLNRKLNTWLTEADSVIGPVLCTHKTATGDLE